MTAPTKEYVRIESQKTVHPNTPLERLKTGGLVRIYERTGMLTFSFKKPVKVSQLKFECPEGKGPARFELFADQKSMASGELEPSDGTTIVFPEVECKDVHLFYSDSHSFQSVFFTKVEIS